MNATTHTYRSQAARDAAASGYGGESYPAYLDDHAQRTHDYFIRHGDPEQAARMFTQTLSEALMGNEGA